MVYTSEQKYLFIYYMYVSDFTIAFHNAQHDTC